ncbi:hypothetical protein ACP81J_23955, partial [Escherichia coli]
RDMDVTIVVHSPGSIGSTPSVEVQSIHAGFDWDSGKVLIFPAQPLTTLTPEQVADITDSVRKGQSWHAYQEYKKHKEQLEKLSIELDAAKQRVAELEASRVTLAEENSWLKMLIEDHAGCTAVCPNCSHEEPSETDDIVWSYRSRETPATDAFLAEVRAQAFNDLCSVFVKDATVVGLDDGDIVTVKEATDACCIVRNSFAKEATSEQD